MVFMVARTLLFSHCSGIRQWGVYSNNSNVTQTVTVTSAISFNTVYSVMASDTAVLSTANIGVSATNNNLIQLTARRFSEGNNNISYARYFLLCS